MTVLEQLVAQPKPMKWQNLINRHTPQTGHGYPVVQDWGRKGQSHYKDGTFSKN
ncbi:hypothetical protein [Alloactinosynnema sp. L-07]|uniref:multiple cyclophane-containing RiPP AmcA n=1 Tax=Alloactinosynnema sp. L-07 TaxID=1653480 RepID=UPI00065EF224|nr:multiple cyclophane-containing RiPP AmcA [Alloactinosynnema sp. L-07]CRK60510.1 hypothetical protein [Alloactinosynnema sp. L-07]